MRAKALQHFAQCATSEDSSLVLSVKQALHEALEQPADGTPTLNRQNNGGSTGGFNLQQLLNNKSVLAHTQSSQLTE